MVTLREEVQRTLFQEIEKLPDSQLQEVLGFVQQLLNHDSSKASTDFQDLVLKETIKTDDPLLYFIGAVSQGTLAHSLDDELYGS